MAQALKAQQVEVAQPQTAPAVHSTLEGHQLIKRYGGRAVVDQVEVRIRGGEVVGLLGPNGAGKIKMPSVTAQLTTSSARGAMKRQQMKLKQLRAGESGKITWPRL